MAALHPGGGVPSCGRAESSSSSCRSSPWWTPRWTCPGAPPIRSGSKRPARASAEWSGSGSSLLAVLALLSAASLVVRFRRAHGEERKQIEWLAYGGVLLAVYLLLTTLGEWTKVPVLVDSFAMTALSARRVPLDPHRRRRRAAPVPALRDRRRDPQDAGRGACSRPSSPSCTWGSSWGSERVVAGASDGPLADHRRGGDRRRLPTGSLRGEPAVQPIGVRRTCDAVRGAVCLLRAALRGYATEDLLPRMARILGEGTGAQRAEVWLRVGDVVQPAAMWPANGSEGSPRIAARSRTASFRSWTGPAPFRFGTRGSCSVRWR